MTTKNVAIQVLFRDPDTQDVIGAENGTGTTEDDGLTVVIGNGYLPYITTVPPADILRTLIPPPVELPAVSGVSRVDDVEANTSTLTFTLPE
jgi:hypothetical protein